MITQLRITIEILFLPPDLLDPRADEHRYAESFSERGRGELIVKGIPYDLQACRSDDYRAAEPTDCSTP
jgi:hypothetical protein